MNKITKRALEVQKELQELFNTEYISIQERCNTVEICVHQPQKMRDSWSSRYAMLKALAELLECTEIDTHLFRNDDTACSCYGDEDETFICWAPISIVEEG